MTLHCSLLALLVCWAAGSTCRAGCSLAPSTWLHPSLSSPQWRCLLPLRPYQSRPHPPLAAVPAAATICPCQWRPLTVVTRAAPRRRLIWTSCCCWHLTVDMRPLAWCPVAAAPACIRHHCSRIAARLTATAGVVAMVVAVSSAAARQHGCGVASLWWMLSRAVHAPANTCCLRPSGARCAPGRVCDCSVWHTHVCTLTRRTHLAAAFVWLALCVASAACPTGPVFALWALDSCVSGRAASRPGCMF